LAALCQVHYARNLLGMVGAARRKDLAAGLRGVFAAPTGEQALRNAEELAEAWRASHPKVAEHIEGHIEECLTCAWPSRRATAGASAPPTARRG
jgi:transposase-like protein